MVDLGWSCFGLHLVELSWGAIGVEGVFARF